MYKLFEKCIVTNSKRFSHCTKIASRIQFQSTFILIQINAGSKNSNLLRFGTKGVRFVRDMFLFL